MTTTGTPNSRNQWTDCREEQRLQAVKTLGDFGGAESIPILVEAVLDPSVRVREAALTALAGSEAPGLLDYLEECLRDGENARRRNSAIEVLPRLGKRSTPVLLRLLKDKDADVRLFAIQIVGLTRDDIYVEELLTCLEDSDENIRHAAAESLGKIGDARAVAPLLHHLEEDFWVRYAAIQALGDIGDQRATRPLLDMLSDDMVKEIAIEALGKLGDPAAIPALVRVLLENEPAVRNTVISALARIRASCEVDEARKDTAIRIEASEQELGGVVRELLASLEAEDVEVRRNAVIALGWLKAESAVDKLVALLRDYDLEVYIAGALASIGSRALPPLLSSLSDPEPSSRVAAARCIEWLELPEGLIACIPLLKDISSEVRLQAACTLTRAAEAKEIEDALLNALESKDEAVRNIAIEALGRSQSGRLVPRLLEILETDSGPATTAAIKILGSLREDAAVSHLNEALSSHDEEVRAEAFRALRLIEPGAIGSKQLQDGIRDPSARVRRAAAEAAACTGHRSKSIAADLLNDEDREIRMLAIRMFGKLSPSENPDTLISVFKRSDKSQKLEAVTSMGATRNKGFLSVLVDILKWDEAEMKCAAAQALGEIGDGKATPELLIAIDDAEWSVRCAAIQALSAIGDARAIPAVSDKLSDPEMLVRKAAVRALCSFGARTTASRMLPLLHQEGLQLDVAEAIVSLGVADTEAFREYWKRLGTKLRILLLSVVGRLRDRRFKDLLVETAVGDFSTARCAAIRALGELGDRSVAGLLLRIQRTDASDEVRKEAAVALTKVDEQR